MGMTKLVISSKQQARALKGKTDAQKLKQMTDAEIHKAADADAQPLTNFELLKFKPFIFLKRKFRL